MIRGVVVAAAAACVAIGGAPVAMADPNDNLYFDKPGRYASDVPFMNYEARLSAPCDNFEINTFGRGPGVSRCNAIGSRTSGRPCTPASG